MVLRCSLALFALLIAAPARAEGPREREMTLPIRGAIQAEVERLARAEAAARRVQDASAPARPPNRAQRHPVRTAAIVGGLSGFAIGWAAGDDGVFDDFTGEFNGVLLGGICAGAGASIVAIVQAARR